MSLKTMGEFNVSGFSEDLSDVNSDDTDFLLLQPQTDNKHIFTVDDAHIQDISNDSFYKNYQTEQNLSDNNEYKNGTYSSSPNNIALHKLDKYSFEHNGHLLCSNDDSHASTNKAAHTANNSCKENIQSIDKDNSHNLKHCNPSNALNNSLEELLGFNESLYNSINNSFQQSSGKYEDNINTSKVTKKLKTSPTISSYIRHSAGYNKQSTLGNKEDFSTLEQIDDKVKEGQELLEKLFLGSHHKSMHDVITHKNVYSSPIRDQKSESLNHSHRSNTSINSGKQSHKTSLHEEVRCDRSFHNEIDNDEISAIRKNDLPTPTEEKLPIPFSLKKNEEQVVCDHHDNDIDTRNIFSTSLSGTYTCDDLNSLRVQCEEAASMLNSLKQKIEEEKLQLQQGTITEVRSLQKQNNILIEQVSYLSSALTEKTSICVQLQDAIAEKKMKCAELKELLTNKNLKYSELRDLLAKKNMKCSELQDDLVSKNLKCAELEDLLDEKLKEICKLITTDDLERDNLQNEINSLQKRETALNQQLTDIEQAYSEQCSQLKDFESKSEMDKVQQIQLEQSHKNEKSKLQLESKQVKMKLKTEEENRELLQSEVKQLKELLESNQNSKQFLENEVQQLTLALKTEEKSTILLRSEVDQLRVTLQSERKNTNHLQSEVDQLKATLESERKNTNLLQSEVDQLKAALKTEEMSTNLLQSENKQIKSTLLNEQEEKVKMKNQHVIECNHYKKKIEYLQTNNVKLKEDINKSQKYFQHMRESNTLALKRIKDEMNVECDDLKQKLLQNEKIEKSLALELAEECTKLAVIINVAPVSPKTFLSPKRKENNVISEALNVLKDHLDSFRHYTLSLRQENERLLTNTINQSSDESLIPSPSNSQTSTKLLKHLQSRVQQLRKENTSLKEHDTSSHTAEEVLTLTKQVKELELTLQKSELDLHKKTNLLQQKSAEVTKLQRVLKQATKENMKLERSYAWLQKHSFVQSQFAPLVASSTHQKALGPSYYGTNIQKCLFRRKSIPWSLQFAEYTPIDYTSDVVLKKPSWADPDIRNNTMRNIQFNVLDLRVNRKSYMGKYDVIDGVPRNPIGRTGMVGRGLLGRWGPNHAADPIVTRWSRNESGLVQKISGKPVLEFVAIQRKDLNQWAIPGGMVNAGENISLTLKREFGEEALNSIEASTTELTDIKSRIDDVFHNGVLIYKGYVDDPRNTDNAWMETVAVNFHDNTGDSVGMIPLKAGDDAKDVCWLRVDRKLSLYASHAELIKHTCLLHQAYYEE